MLKIDDLAPSFSLPSTLGKKISLRDYRGKNVILYFYPAAGGIQLQGVLEKHVIFNQICHGWQFWIQ